MRAELENAQTALNASQSHRTDGLVGESKTTDETGQDTEESRSAILDKLDEKKKELVHCTFSYTQSCILLHYLFFPLTCDFFLLLLFIVLF